ncbi:MAG: glutathione S-transferase family protein [Parvibaculales bacterium]
MIDLYFWPTPNGYKASLALEEMGLDYQVKPVNILKGDQHEAAFLKLNPNNRVPTIVDHDGPDGQPHTVFESGAILIYLARKAGKFLPEDPVKQSVVLQWLFFQCANVGPMFGQCGHFKGYAPEKVQYGIDRYFNETVRLYGLMDKELSARDYLAGEYSIADMATYPWCADKVRDLHEINLDDFPNVKAWVERLEARPAVQKGMTVLADVMKIGNPDEDAREALFGKK